MFQGPQPSNRNQAVFETAEVILRDGLIRPGRRMRVRWRLTDFGVSLELLNLFCRISIGLCTTS